MTPDHKNFATSTRGMIFLDLEKRVERMRANPEVMSGDLVSVDVDTPGGCGVPGSQAQGRVYNDNIQNYSTVNDPTSGRSVEVGNMVNSRERRHDSDDSNKD